MSISNNIEVQTSQGISAAPQTAPLPKQELIELFKDLDVNNDNVLNTEDSLVKTLEDILMGRSNTALGMDLNDDMAKYLILRNMSKGKEISLENISDRFNEVWELCQNDEETQFLLKKLDETFEKHSVGTSKVTANEKQAESNYAKNNAEIENKAKEFYAQYSEKCKEEGFEPMSYEEFKADFDHNFKKNYEKINDTEKIANDCFNLNDKIVINQIFLKEFGTYYPQLQIRIKTLEQKNVANNLRNNNSTTNTSNNEYTKDQIPASFKTPTFGLK